MSCTEIAVQKKKKKKVKAEAEAEVMTGSAETTETSTSAPADTPGPSSEDSDSDREKVRSCLTSIPLLLVSVCLVFADGCDCFHRKLWSRKKEPFPTSGSHRTPSNCCRVTLDTRVIIIQSPTFTMIYWSNTNWNIFILNVVIFII